MHVYTKTGDAGESGLYTGERVKKSSLRVDVYGTIDEADAAFGMARAFATKAEVKTAILGIQKKLSSLMADIASLDKGPIIHEEDVIALESAMDDIEERLPKLTSFLIPGDTPAGACLDQNAGRRVDVRRAFLTLHFPDRACAGGQQKQKRRQNCKSFHIPLSPIFRRLQQGYLLRFGVFYALIPSFAACERPENAL